MKGLFAKIFLWFWITGTLTGIASVLAVLFLHHPPKQPSSRVFQDTALAYGTAAVDVLEEEGRSAAADYIRELSKNTRIQGCIFDDGANALAGERCSDFQQFASQVLAGARPSRSATSLNSTMTAVRIDSVSKQHYVFVSGLVTGPHSPPTYDLKEVALRGSIAVLVSGLICFFLARYLTRPILILRSVAQSVTAGNLSARVDGSIAKRGDELGEFARDFNRMAGQTEHLIYSQRQLVYDISHELRSPLARLNVALDIIRGRVANDSAVDRMDGDLQQLNEMIGRILTVAKLEATAQLESSHEVALSELIASIVHDADFEALERSSRVELLGTADVVVSGDHNLIRSAIENVVRNAVRFTSPGTAVEIRLTSSEIDGQARALVRIRDHGPGVPEHELENIFRAFYRVTDSGSRSSEGVGLGLSITDRIVRLHKGVIRASNAPEGGLQVDIELPLSARLVAV
ncbi:MAG TPA: ATP-binding protein [Candidatus Saccharimonadales bacterium]|nr:ATP-binding protein [Candidatus Saccharimonadales bacterium]